MMPKLRPQYVPILATMAVFLLLFSAVSVRYGGFFSWFQFSSLLADNASLGLAATGMTFVILSGGIDLSVGAVIALASMLMAMCLTQWELSPQVAIPVVMAAGTGFGAGMGALIRWFRLPPFLVTLAGMFLARGIALVLTNDKRISITDHPIYDWFFDTEIGWSDYQLPLPAIVFLCAISLAIVVARSTRFGRTVYAVGGNERSALLMGLPVGRTKVKVYALSGLCAATGGVVHALGTGAGDASIAYMLELDAIAAVVIGGTLLSGGVGYVLGTLFGVLILGVITVIPSYQGNLNSWWTKIAIGLLLLVFIVLQRFLQRHGSKQ
ncbi:MAG TPA: galactofuranose ABC transporter, permease protein YjfF [Pirellulales bacterium]|nr:galactofuranose ABC transporter, permease protein YjfF [Pirellulales bacterium]